MTKKTDAQLITSNNTTFTSNGTQSITGYAINAFFQDLIDSKLSNNDTNTGLSSPSANVMAMYAGGQLIGQWQQGTITGMRMYKPIYFSFASSIAAAASMDIGVATGQLINITGTGISIASLGSNAIQGAMFFLKFAAANTLVNSANLLCPGGANIVTAANDKAIIVYNGSGIWEIWEYRRFATAP